MNTNAKENVRQVPLEEFAPKSSNGMAILLLNIVLCVAAVLLLIFGAAWMDEGSTLGTVLFIIGVVYICAPAWILFMGLKIIRPNEAMVLTLFGKYHGTLRGEGFYFVNPFVSAMGTPLPVNATSTTAVVETGTEKGGSEKTTRMRLGRTISLKALTLNNDRQKINDKLGNPIIIGIVVIWRVTNTVKAVFNVDNYVDFLSIQCDSALRNIVRMYPYDASDAEDEGEGEGEKSLRGSSQEIAEKLREEIAAKTEVAGLEIMEARITHLAYAPEIAAAMLQRQQAAAIVDARQLIVEGAVGMVEMALERLGEHNVVDLDEERKAAMVSNLMVVLCGNRDAQPIVNSGSIY